MSELQGTFRADLGWQALIGLMQDGLGDCDIAPISENDFEGDDLVLTPPSVRTFFAGSGFTPMGDAQMLSYQTGHRFIALCGDEDRSSVANQAFASLALAGKVADLLVGARILLGNGEVSEPAYIVSIEPQPVKGFGLAYAVAFILPGLAQFTGINANPSEDQ